MARGARGGCRIALCTVILASVSCALTTTADAEPVVYAAHYLPGDAGGSVPNAVPYGPLVCVAAGTCTTVGPFHNQSGQGTATVLSQAAGVWGSPRAVILPANALAPTSGGYSGLNALSCWSAGNCVAVGFYAVATTLSGSVIPVPVPMAVDEVSGTWSAAREITLPSSTEVETGELSAVSCDAGGDCTALGYYLTVDDVTNVDVPYPVAVVKGMGATSWSAAVDIPIDTGAPMLTYPTAVSCSSASTCVAVEAVLSGSSPVAEQDYFVDEDAGTWMTPTPVASAGRDAVELDALTCSAVGSCVASGGAAPSAADLAAQNAVVPAVDVEASGSWSTPRALNLPLLSPLSNEGFLNSVSCASATTCVAAGAALESPSHTRSVPLVAAWVSGTWTLTLDAAPLMATASPAAVGVLAGVDCVSALTCEAVGDASTGTFHHTDTGTAFASTIAPTQVPRAPSRPSNVTVVPGAVVTRVTFAPPSSDGGSRITVSTVIAVTKGAPTERCTTAGTSCTFRGAVKGKTYVVTVTATNSVGASPPSPPRTFIAL